MQQILSETREKILQVHSFDFGSVAPPGLLLLPVVPPLVKGVVGSVLGSVQPCPADVWAGARTEEVLFNSSVGSIYSRFQYFLS